MKGQLFAGGPSLAKTRGALNRVGPRGLLTNSDARRNRGTDRERRVQVGISGF